ncbi:mandelate racemase/muconate lactonizing enzyme family protein [uncultured Roseobacter sp.]|uniref:mandelate racemase/muconate lactonizing enzyme family protein n=1 Tax=uncultured Roseobacter sp. TaxID=114847 RepID=UPI0026252339|nr:mandelate racemase/muconate lactonizing enzyme family protein [uncultured Roseobacter sp.]
MRIERIEVFVFRAPTPAPVATSFGVMRDRPAVFVRLTDDQGVQGWGEIFANWPAAGAEHRAHLLIRDIGPMFLGRAFDSPWDLWTWLSDATHIRALQCGEPGPFAQVLAGLDTAAHDICARHLDMPLARALNPEALAEVPVYASGIAIDRADPLISAARRRGISRFKVKVGFDMEQDLARLAALVADFEPHESLCADANQAWSIMQALTFLSAGAGLGLTWLEEPLPADRPATEWAALANVGAIPLAAGENIAGSADFSAALAAGHLSFLQPDVAKWGGVSGCWQVAQEALRASVTYCPHYLGGGIGLIASAHLLAAAGGPGVLELDANPNPLRDAFFDHDPVQNGRWQLNTEPGLGISDLPQALLPFETLALELS